MRIREQFGRGRPVISFEFFPPKTEAGFDSLFRAIAKLKELSPAFVSVTWGAGGSTRSKTVELTARIQDEVGITAMSHLTCVGSGVGELGAHARAPARARHRERARARRRSAARVRRRRRTP